MALPGFFPNCLQSFQLPGVVLGQFLPSQEGPASIPVVHQDPSAEVRRWDIGADFPEPSFKVDLNCQSCYTSESHLWRGACLCRECWSGQHHWGIST